MVQNKGSTIPLVSPKITRSYLKDNLLILDGALGTELENRGFNVNHKLWSALVLAQQPEQVYKVHKDYFESGASIATTCTYQASVPGFIEAGISNTEAEALELIKRAVDLAKSARDDYWKNITETEQSADAKIPQPKYPLVAASIGPYGAYLGTGAEYTGDYGSDISKHRLYEFHKPRILAVVRASPDLLALETIPRQDEVNVLLQLLEELAPDIPFWLSFSLKDSETLADGSKLPDLIENVLHNSSSSYDEHINHINQLVAIGANCLPIEKVSSVLDELRQLSDLPLIVYPNSGETYDAISKSWSKDIPSSQEPLASNYHNWYQKGARIIGGCCRTRREDIAELSRMVAGGAL